MRRHNPSIEERGGLEIHVNEQCKGIFALPISTPYELYELLIEKKVPNTVMGDIFEKNRITTKKWKDVYNTNKKKSIEEIKSYVDSTEHKLKSAP